MRPDWNEVRVDVMRQCLLSKFSSEDLSSRFLLTGDRQLVEGNHWGDRFWGVDDRTWQGLNHLGELLMEIRGARRP